MNFQEWDLDEWLQYLIADANIATVPCPDFYAGRFHLKNKLKMLIYENDRFCQEINSDQSFIFNSFLARFRPNQTKTLVLEEEI
jgi:hypothetical protein